MSLLLMAQPPQARRAPSTENFHGTAVTEDYRWLEDADSAETRAWVQAQVKHTQAYLEKLPSRARFRTRLEQLYQYDRYSTYQERGGLQFYQRQSGLENQPSLYVRKPGEAPRVLLDPNTLSKEGTTAIGSFSISHDGKHLAYSIAKAGSDWIVWHIREVATGKDLAETIDWSKFSGAEWDVRSEGFYYGRFPAPASGNALQAVNEHYKLSYHKLGTPQSEDRLIYERPDQPRWSFGGDVSEDGHWLVLTIEKGTDVETQVAYIDLSKPGSKGRLR